MWGQGGTGPPDLNTEAFRLYLLESKEGGPFATRLRTRQNWRRGSTERRGRVSGGQAQGADRPLRRQDRRAAAGRAAREIPGGGVAAVRGRARLPRHHGRVAQRDGRSVDPPVLRGVPHPRRRPRRAAPPGQRLGRGGGPGRLRRRPGHAAPGSGHRDLPRLRGRRDLRPAPHPDHLRGDRRGQPPAGGTATGPPRPLGRPHLRRGVGGRRPRRGGPRDYRLAATAFIGSVNGLLHDWSAGWVDATLDEVVDELVRWLLGILRPPGWAPGKPSRSRPSRFRPVGRAGRATAAPRPPPPVPPRPPRAPGSPGPRPARGSRAPG